MEHHDSTSGGACLDEPLASTPVLDDPHAETLLRAQLGRDLTGELWATVAVDGGERTEYTGRLLGWGEDKQGPWVMFDNGLVFGIRGADPPWTGWWSG